MVRSPKLQRKNIEKLISRKISISKEKISKKWIIERKSFEKVKYLRTKSWIVSRIWCDYNYQTEFKYIWNFIWKECGSESGCGCRVGVAWVWRYKMVIIMISRTYTSTPTHQHLPTTSSHTGHTLLIRTFLFVNLYVVRRKKSP
jgi:hypothetical protein